jgi:hypothetical protein
MEKQTDVVASAMHSVAERMKVKESTLEKVAAKFHQLTGRRVACVYQVQGKRHPLTYCVADGLVYFVGFRAGQLVGDRLLRVPEFTLVGRA